MRFITFLNYPLINWKQADLNSQRLSTLYYKRADSSSASAILFLQHPQSAKTYQENIAAAFAWNVLVAISEYHVWVAACKMSKYGVFSGPYFPAFSCIFSRSGSRNSCPHNLKVWHMDLMNFGGHLMVLVVPLMLNSPNN